MSLDSQATDMLSAIVGALIYVSGLLVIGYAVVRWVVKSDAPEDEP